MVVMFVCFTFVTSIILDLLKATCSIMFIYVLRVRGVACACVCDGCVAVCVNLLWMLCAACYLMSVSEWKSVAKGIHWWAGFRQRDLRWIVIMPHTGILYLSKIKELSYSIEMFFDTGPFSSSITKEQNKLERFFWSKPF